MYEVPYHRALRIMLSGSPNDVRAHLGVAESQARLLRRRLAELDLLIARGWDLLDDAGSTAPWAFAEGPRRPPTLHQAMAIVLASRDNAWTFSRALAIDIARRGLYRRRDGLPASARDVSARAATYTDLFEREFYHLRLREPASTFPASAIDDGDDPDGP